MILRIWNKFTSVISAICVLATGAWAAKPPATKAAVSHPTTQVAVNKPTTKAVVNKPETKVVVNKPITTVVVTHPQTPSDVISGDKKVLQPVATKVAVDNSVATNGKQGNKSMMSTYKAPQAKDLTASPLGGGATGLGNKPDPNKTPSLDIPQAEAVSLDSITKGASANLRSTINKAVDKSK